MSNNSIQNVVIIGLGYVGLPLALIADQKGYSVTGVEMSPHRVELVNNHQSPFADKRVQDALTNSHLIATTDISVVEQADVVIICVPTPVYENRLPDYGPVEAACTGIAPYLKPGQLIVLESTVNPGVCDEIITPILEETSGLKVSKDIFLAHCPERINPGDPKWFVGNIPRVVGGADQKSLDLAYDFYSSIIDAPIKKMFSLREAEAVKVVENSFRNVNIAFVNELAESFSQMGIDVVHVIDGAATKPFAFMAHYPGCGIGGHCIPVDPYYLIDYAKKTNGFDHNFLALACKTNEHMPEFTVELLAKELIKEGKSLSGAEIAVLGLAYKGNVDDLRESPAEVIIKILEGKGAKVRTFDPHILGLSTHKSLSDALHGSDAAILATAHNEFKTITPDDLLSQNIKIIIDGRNCLDKDTFIASGINYHGIGR